MLKNAVKIILMKNQALMMMILHHAITKNQKTKILSLIKIKENTSIVMMQNIINILEKKSNARKWFTRALVR